MVHRRADVPAIGLRPNWDDLDIVFPSAVGTLRDPSNIDHQLKDALTTAGYQPWDLTFLKAPTLCKRASRESSI